MANGEPLFKRHRDRFGFGASPSPALLLKQRVGDRAEHWGGSTVSFPTPLPPPAHGQHGAGSTSLNPLGPSTLMHQILASGNGSVCPGKEKSSICHSRVGSKRIYKFQGYLSNFYTFCKHIRRKAFLHNDMTRKLRRIHVRPTWEKYTLP